MSIDLTQLYNVIGNALEYFLQDAQDSVCIYDSPEYRKIPLYVFYDKIDVNIVSIPVILDSFFNPKTILYEGEDYTISGPGNLVDITGKLSEMPVKYCPFVYVNDKYLYFTWGHLYTKEFDMDPKLLKDLISYVAKLQVLGPIVSAFNKDSGKIKVVVKDAFIDEKWIDGLVIPKEIAGNDILVQYGTESWNIYETYFKHSLFGVFITAPLGMDVTDLKERILESRPLNSYPIFVVSYE